MGDNVAPTESTPLLNHPVHDFVRSSVSELEFA
jgi:hypothetical protein